MAKSVFLEPEQGDDLLTPQEVANRLRVSIWAVYRIAGTKLPCIRISRKNIRFTQRDVDKFIKTRRMGI